MTRRELATHLSKDLRSSGLHFIEGSTVFRTISGEWGAMPGTQEPPPDTLFYEVVGWDQRPKSNTILNVETCLRSIEFERTGYSELVDRSTIPVRSPSERRASQNHQSLAFQKRRVKQRKRLDASP